MEASKGQPYSLTGMQTIPDHLIVQHILPKIVSGENSMKDWTSFRQSCKSHNSLSKTPSVLKFINLNKHPLFDEESPRTYANFIMECAQERNEQAIFLLGMSYAFCRNKGEEDGISQLKQAKHYSHHAAYCYSMLTFSDLSLQEDAIKTLESLAKLRPATKYHFRRFTLHLLEEKLIKHLVFFPVTTWSCPKDASCGQDITPATPANKNYFSIYACCSRCKAYAEYRLCSRDFSIIMNLFYKV